jgi:REP element-mobilizing transposase RayT
MVLFSAVNDHASSTFQRLPDRQHPIHLPTCETHNRAIIVFLTVCTKDRKRVLASKDALEQLTHTWRDATFWRVGRFVVMPDHIHLFCAPGCWPPHPLQRWISLWQRAVSLRWPRPDEKPLWQKGYWDRQLRRGESYTEKWNYVVKNPVRHGLVASADRWPYQGEIDVLRWHD